MLIPKTWLNRRVLISGYRGSIPGLVTISILTKMLSFIDGYNLRFARGKTRLVFRRL
jgi:hypothetical protein